MTPRDRAHVLGALMLAVRAQTELTLLLLDHLIEDPSSETAPLDGNGTAADDEAATAEAMAKVRAADPNAVAEPLQKPRTFGSARARAPASAASAASAPASAPASGGQGPAEAPTPGSPTTDRSTSP